jgi:membrane-associated phospholipid phosphatase
MTLPSTQATDAVIAAEPIQAPVQRWSGARWLAWLGWPMLIALLIWAISPDRQVALFTAINLQARALPDWFWSMLTLFGDTAVLLVGLSPLLLWRRQALVAAIAAIPAGGLMSVSAKRLADAPRPAAVLDAAQFHLIGPTLNLHSFPSGHTITAFAAASAVLAVILPGKKPIRMALLAAAIIALAAAVGLSRIAVGAHWPRDVLAGALFGWLAGLSGAWLTRRFPVLWRSQRLAIGLAALLFAIGVWVLLRRVEYPLGAAAVWLVSSSCAMTMIALARRRIAGELA